MSKKKIPSPFRNFEGRKINDCHIRLTFDMLNCEKYKNLSPNAKTLYTYMRKASKGNREFYYTQSMALKYDKIMKSSATFTSCRNELVQKGFITIKEGYKSCGIPTLYEFSDKWSK